MNNHSRLHDRVIFRQRGLSLVELMVALVIGLILTAGVISVYITSKKSYSVDTGLAQVQENGRFALSFMEPLVRMGGYMGCTRSTPIDHLQNTNGTTPPVTVDYDFSKPVQGYDANSTDVSGSYTVPSAFTVDTSSSDWTPNLPTQISGALDSLALKGNDILVLHEAAGLQLPIQPDGGGNYQQSAGVFLPEGSESLISEGQIAIVSDCSQASLFQITSVNDTGQAARMDHSNNSSLSPGNNGPVWNETYGKGSTLSIAQTYVFFIGLSGADNSSPALYEVSYNDSGATAGEFGSPQELVPDIENMQILYGVDTSGDKIPDQFVSAATVDSASEWDKVVAVRIALLSRSDDLSTDAKPVNAPSFNLNDVTVTTPIDRRIRKVFVQTIALRNLLP